MWILAILAIFILVGGPIGLYLYGRPVVAEVEEYLEMGAHDGT